MNKTGIIYGINGPVIYLKGDSGFKISEMVYVGKDHLVGEVIGLKKGMTTIQVFEETTGLRPGETVIGTGDAISVTLGPGILNNIFDGIERPLSEKKRYIFMAYVGACISGFIIASRDASKMALEIPNITISVLIGAYVPFTLLLEDGKKGKVELQSMKEEWEEKYKKTFRERKVKDILSALLFAMVYGVLLVGALSPAQNIINDIASGIGMGMATVVVAFVGLVEVKNRLTKRRNKREDADQEKSDTE